MPASSHWYTEASSVSLVARPLMDALLFRWGIKSLWGWWMQLQQEQPPSGPWTSGDALRTRQSWMIWSSILFALSHLRTTGALDQYWWTRFSWGEDRNTMMAWSIQSALRLFVRVAIYALWSWGLLCPLYQSHGLLASVGAQLIWSLVRLARHNPSLLRELTVVHDPCKPTMTSRNAAETTITKNQTDGRHDEVYVGSCGVGSLSEEVVIEPSNEFSG